MLTKKPQSASRLSARKDGRLAGKSLVKSRPQRHKSGGVDPIQRLIQKRMADKPAFVRTMRQLAPNAADAEIEQAWNKYQLTRALGEARYNRSRFLHLYRRIRHFAKDLADTDKQLKADKLTERTAMKYALWSVESFLRSMGYHAGLLYQLNLDLNALEHGITPPSLKASKKEPGRKPDSAQVQELKGRLAGIARLQMASGMSRSDAAAWVARNASSGLARRLSSKSFITTRSVKQYMDQYDCGPTLLKRFEQAEERKAFRVIFDVATKHNNHHQFPLEQINFLRALVPPRKMRMHQRNDVNPLAGLFGFALQVYLGASFLAEGYEPPCRDFVKDLEQIAVERVQRASIEHRQL